MQETLGLKEGTVIRHRIKYAPHNLYPNIPWVNGKPIRAPTASEIASAFEQVKSYRMLTSGLNMIPDPLDKTSVIAIVEFTPYEELTDSQKEDLNYVSNFLHKSKRFINGVKSCSRVWGGLMWAIGWRKSYDEDQIVGRYIKAFDETKMRAFDEHYVKSSRVGQILGNLFKDLARTPFQDNQDLMKKYNIPSFPDLAYGKLPEDSTCTPHITFTTNGFYNPPHKDDKDISQWAFVLFLPTRTSDYTIVDSSEYDITSGPFIFPDHRIGINFDHHHGIVKMIWQANRYTHCTMPHSKSSRFTRLGMSIQINSTLALTCEKYMKGFYQNIAHYFGDHFYYMFRSMGRSTLIETSVTILFYFTLFSSF